MGMDQKSQFRFPTEHLDQRNDNAKTISGGWMWLECFLDGLQGF